MQRENPLWGAPRIHGEILMLGIQVSESTVSNYLATLPRRRPSQRKGKHYDDYAMSLQSTPNSFADCARCLSVVSN
jgi:hypothetical protein